MVKKLAILAVFIFGSTIYAHEGHHDTPGTVAAPKGGVIKSLETVHLELLQQGKLVKIYVYDKELKPVEAKNYPVSATATRPRKKAEKVELKTNKNHWEYMYDAKGSHRYTLQFNIKQDGHNDKLKWNIEPKK